MGYIERQRVVIPYDPRQPFLPYHHRKQRWSCIVAHRRAGKTVACVNELIKAALTCEKPEPRLAYVAPLYAQAKDVAWSYLKNFTMAIPGATAHESELRVDLPGNRRIRLYGADNYDRMRGIYLDGLILDEYGDMDPRAWPEVLRPALSDRQGWATFIGTPKGRNDFYRIMHGDDLWCGAVDDPEWFAMTLKASETGLIAQSELDDAKKIMTPEQYAQEYECSFDAAIVGAYYGTTISQLEVDGRIRDVPWEPTLPVYTSWDLGLDDATSIWFVQIAGGEIRVIDHYEVSNKALSEIPRVLLSEKPYIYAEHYLPHDAEIRELMTAKSRKDTLEGLGLRPIKIASRQSVEEGINAVRNMLPKCVFDKTKCKQGLESLKQYRREWDEKAKTFRQRPLHDWTSHAADSFRYMAMSLQERAAPKPLNYKAKRYA